MRSTAVVIAFVLASASIQAQNPVQPDPPHREWRAAWITHPTAPLREPVVLHFRRTLELATIPANYPVRVSADNRFILFVNGHRVGDGPARGDLPHWRYEVFDLAPLLHTGANLVTATVWNFGVYAPVSQMSDRTAFLLESEAAAGPASISTPEGWLVEEEHGQSLLGRDTVTIKTYFASGPGEELDASKYDWDWNSATPGKNWVPAASPMRDSIFPDTNKAHSADTTGDNFWGLIPDQLPAMEFKPTSAGEIVRSDLPGLKGLPATSAAVPGGSAYSSAARSQNPYNCIPATHASPVAKAQRSASPTPKLSTTKMSTKAIATP